MKLLLVDNEDSFTRNLEHLLATATGLDPVLMAYADFTPSDAWEAGLLVISPGPGHPSEYPKYQPLFAQEAPRLPVLGICLGMQIMNHALGGDVARLPGCFHGRAEAIDFMGQHVRVARYHSLYCSRLAPGLILDAATDQGVPMAVHHQDRPLVGYQFHPESFLTEAPEAFILHALARLLPA